MKILFLASHMNSGGAERTIAYLSSYLANRNMDITILTLEGSVFYSIDDKVCLKSLNIPSVTKNYVERIVLAFKRLVKIRNFLTKNKYDIIFCMLPDMAKYILGIKRKQRFKLITSERNNPYIVTDKKKINLKNKIYSKADGVVFQTQRAMDFYSEEIRKKGIIIQNAIGNEYVYEAPIVVERKKKITSIGRLSAQKDYPTLFDAFKKVLEKYPEYTLEIFGNGPDEEILKALTNALNISDNVIFMGAHKDAILQASDSACYVMSSKYEGMPNALMEAMAVGLPCVSTDCPNGPAELITSGENGLLVPVGDSEALAEAILKMIEDKPFSEMCGKNARKILDTHSIEIKAKEYMDYILKIYKEGEL